MRERMKEFQHTCLSPGTRAEKSNQTDWTIAKTGQAGAKKGDTDPKLIPSVRASPSAVPGPDISTTGNLLQIHLLRSHLGSTESQTLEGRGAICVLTSPPGNFCPHSSLRATPAGQRDSSFWFHPLPTISFSDFAFQVPLMPGHCFQ